MSTLVKKLLKYRTVGISMSRKGPGAVGDTQCHPTCINTGKEVTEIQNCRHPHVMERSWGSRVMHNVTQHASTLAK
jgi:hypothetical protein